jgi:hypothetical protein
MTTTALLVPVDVELTHESLPGIGDGYSVNPIWDGVDRPNVGGIWTPNLKAAELLRECYLEGNAFSATEVRTDVDGKTYVGTTSRISGRHLIADLKKLGYAL